MKSFFEKNKSTDALFYHLKYSSKQKIEDVINNMTYISINCEKLYKLPKIINNNELDLVLSCYDNQTFKDIEFWNIKELLFLFPYNDKIVIDNKNIKAIELHISGSFNKVHLFYDNFTLVRKNSHTEINYL